MKHAFVWGVVLGAISGAVLLAHAATLGAEWRALEPEDVHVVVAVLEQRGVPK